MEASIVTIGDPVLRTPAQDVAPERIHAPEFQALIRQMIAAMRDAPGVGLAAPQLGVPLRVIVLEDRDATVSTASPLERQEREREAFPVRVFINPTLHPIGDEKVGFFEGCLSVPGYVGYVERYREVEVTGLDADGEQTTWRVRGWPARILQHEVDHIDGVVYVDRMFTRSFASVAQARARYAGRPIAEVRRLLGIEQPASPGPTGARP